MSRVTLNTVRQWQAAGISVQLTRVPGGYIVRVS